MGDAENIIPACDHDCEPWGCQLDCPCKECHGSGGGGVGN